MRPPPASPSRLPILVLCLAGVAALWFAGRHDTQAPQPPGLPRPVATPASTPAPAYDAAAASELARLRAEAASLREQLDAAQSSLELTNVALDETARELERLRRPLEVDMASATLRANLAPGEGVVTGGYRLPDGTRLFAFVETDALPDGGLGVTGRFYSVPDELAQTLGLQTLATEAANTLQHGEVWVRDELTEIASRIEKNPTARLVSSGSSAIPLGRMTAVPLPGDPVAPTLSFNVSAVYDEQRNLDLELRMESVPAPETPPDAR